MKSSFSWQWHYLGGSLAENQEASRRHSTSPSASLRIYLGRSISLSPSLSPSLRSLSITFSRPPPFHSGTGYYSRAVLSVSARPEPPFAS
ncbi:hypothetical protein CBS147321_574 [Aspergillus niger]|nr:hypothetical protein CBS11852_6089 [Aspergillus niger]KAI2952842.1 hypothetical protein CBS147321_574 [Aspergillus niger]KAI3014452.1 hypothetical protein CBS147345_5205 [Aspergillus niger]